MSFPRHSERYRDDVRARKRERSPEQDRYGRAQKFPFPDGNSYGDSRYQSRDSRYGGYGGYTVEDRGRYGGEGGMEDRGRYGSGGCGERGVQSFGAINKDVGRYGPPQEGRTNPGFGGGGNGYGNGGGRGDGYCNGGEKMRGRGLDGGRVGGRGGFGGRGGNKHMGESPGVSDLLRTHQHSLSDTACLKVMFPPLAEQDRDDLVDGQYHLPKLQKWRADGSVGVRLVDSSRHVIRANFFNVPVAKMPSRIYHYNISMFRFSDLCKSRGFATIDGVFKSLDFTPNDLAKEKDTVFTVKVMKFLMKMHPEWHDMGLAYDCGSSLYTTERLTVLPVATNIKIDESSACPEKEADMEISTNVESQPSDSDFTTESPFEVDIIWPNAREPSLKVIVTPVSCIVPPIVDGKWMPVGLGVASEAEEIACAKQTRTSVMALNVALLSFARWRSADQNPQWIISGSKVFRTDGRVYDLSPQFIGMLGYHASLQATLSGLALVSDISVTCFVRGGNLLDFICAVLRTEKQQLAADFERGRHLVSEFQELLDLLQYSRIRTVHLNQHKKFKSFGPPANSVESSFTNKDELVFTVEQYFFAMNQKFPGKYPKLRFPSLPTVNIGSKKRALLVPVELLEIVPGQTRTRSVTGSISAQIIKHAAVLPNERFQNISRNSSLLQAIGDDQDAEHFGLSLAEPRPLRVTATILPPPKLQYGNQIMEPQLKGAWNLANNVTFAHPAPTHADNTSRDASYPYGAILLHDDREVDQGSRFDDLLKKLESGSRVVGIPLRLLSPSSALQHLGPVAIRQSDVNKLIATLQDFKSLGCCRMTTIKKFPRNYEVSLLVKMNMKMGGVNHTLASRNLPGRSAAGEDPVFQSPPQSINWLFDKASMVVGLDINHPQNRAGSASRIAPPVVAVVASMDGMLGQYCAHISAAEPTSGDTNTTGPALTIAFAKLLKVFCERNEGTMPYHIIVYRDGVADSQYNSMLDTEYSAMREAVDLAGFTIDRIKISIVVCQKHHHTRIVYQATPDSDYLNPCVGLAVDALGSEWISGRTIPSVDAKGGGDPIGSIVGSTLNEFYLNSHAAVLGTSKPTKYVLVRDEIGFKMSELQLLTFWLTHLYCRCTRSVAVATPAYYAHWAARRGAVLMNAGVQGRDLEAMSNAWIQAGMPASMYFI